MTDKSTAFFVAIFFLGCGGGTTTGSGATATGGSGGAAASAGAGGALGGNAGVGGTVGAVPAVCQPACSVVGSCAETQKLGFVQEKCVAQCGREIQGTGTLNPPVAKDVFGFLADHGPDPECKLGQNLIDYGWEGIVASGWPVPPEAEGLYQQFLVVDNKNCSTLASVEGELKMHERFYAMLYQFNPNQHATLLECEGATPKCKGPEECIGFDGSNGGWKLWFGQ